MGQDFLESFLKTLQSTFLEGRLDRLMEYFSLPLVVYSIAGVTVLRTEEEVMQIVNQYRAALVAMRVSSTKLEIVHLDPTHNKRLRATVRTYDFDEDGQSVTNSLIRYFLIEKEESYVIEMMEYLEAPLPPEQIERIVH